jgi:hypothetical protein
VDDPGPSKTLSAPESAEWLMKIDATEKDLNKIFKLVAPRLYADGMEANRQIREANPAHEGVQRWTSAFNGIGVIVNRKTPSHRDKGGRPEWYDFLLAAGTYHDASLDIEDLGAELLYTPGTVVAVCGKLLRHGVKGWEGGERIVYAHYLRDNVMNRLEIPNSSWVTQREFTQYMSAGYKRRMGLSQYCTYLFQLGMEILI